MDFEDYLLEMVKQDGSDLFFSSGAPISIKVFGKLKPLTKAALSENATRAIAYKLMDDDQKAQFEKKLEMNLAISEPGIGRFRVNIFKQRNDISLVIRNIKTEIPAFDSLLLPNILKSLIMQKRGLVLLVGGTGSGKTTSMASLLDYRNENSSGHIITIEDPIEFIHPHKNCIVNQREVGVDTLSYNDALENTLRQSPDVIFIGEVRNMITMDHAIAFSETGHLCVSTLHANNANQAIDRVINFFPEERHKQLLMDLSLNLRAIVSQRLIPTLDNKRAVAVEVMLASPRICELIKNGEIDMLKEVMQLSETQGMQTFDTAIYKLYKEGKISAEEALRNADSRNNLRLRINLDKPNTLHADDDDDLLDNSSTPKFAKAAKHDSLASTRLSLEPIETKKKPAR